MRAEGSESVEKDSAELREDLRRLERKVDGLVTRIAAVETSAPSTGSTNAPPVEIAESESLWSWVGESRFLSRISIVCFVLVVALVLRTLSDGGSIPLQLGVVLGMVYSAGLVAWGWLGLARDRRGKTVLTVCGAVLMCSVVVEARGPFQLLSAGQANWILLATLAVPALLGLAYRNGAVVAFGVLAPAISALTMEFPNLQFPHAAAILFGANLAGVLSAQRCRTSWLPFATLALTLFFWLLWGFKTNSALRGQDDVAATLFADWFLPCLIAFATLFAVAAAVRALAQPKSLGAFHVLAPTVNVLWAYPAALAVVVPSTGNTTALGLTGVFVAMLHFGFAAVLWRRIRECAEGITTFAVAGTALLTIAVVSAVGDFVFALPVWAAVALGLGAFSTVCGNTSLRLSAYVLQGLTCVFAAVGSAFSVPSAAPGLALAAVGVIAALAAVHFRWMRAHPPPSDSFIVSFDPGNRNSIGLLWFAAINAFLLLRLLSYAGIEAMGIELDNTFRGTQSVIINCASIGLMWWGYRTKDKDILGTAVLVAIVGGLKVFVSDLQNASGIPLVLAVFTFGLAAAVGSVVLGKWQAATASVDPESADPDSP